MCSGMMCQDHLRDHMIQNPGRHLWHQGENSKSSKQMSSKYPQNLLAKRHLAVQKNWDVYNIRDH